MDITTEHVDDVAVVTIDRRARGNALRRQSIAQLRTALAAAQDSAAKGIVLAGAGNLFSAGADLGELQGTIEDLKFDDELEQLSAAMRASSLAVVAAVEGACFGAAIDLAWSCDAVVIAGDTRVGLPAARLGILYNPISIQRLHSRLGSGLLRRLMVVGEELTGDAIAATGAAVGVEPGTAVTVALAICRNSAAIPKAQQATKAVLDELDMHAFDAARWQHERRNLLAAPERAQALQRRKNELKGNP